MKKITSQQKFYIGIAVVLVALILIYPYVSDIGQFVKGSSRITAVKPGPGINPPLAVCGDGTCDATESCVTCPSDCGDCTNCTFCSGNTLTVKTQMYSYNLANTMVLTTGDTRTYTYNGKDYVVSLDNVVVETVNGTDYYTAVGNVNGEMFALRSGLSTILADGTMLRCISVIMGKTGEPSYAKFALPDCTKIFADSYGRISCGADQ